MTRSTEPASPELDTARPMRWTWTWTWDEPASDGDHPIAGAYAKRGRTRPTLATAPDVRPVSGGAAGDARIRHGGIRTQRGGVDLDYAMSVLWRPRRSAARGFPPLVAFFA